ncbi:MAG TPA: hypothetical protein VHM20_06425 [Gammaproteobacteria bacterium]|nr:hypothetical protein [Gammaproteobacteria bacterium]
MIRLRIKYLSLIPWAEHIEIKDNQQNLLDRGAILSIDQLLIEVQKIKVTGNKKDKALLVTAIDQLVHYYEGKQWPPSATLDKLIAAKIQESIHNEENEWLCKEYFIQVHIIKKSLFNRYFTQPNYQLPLLDKQFKQAVSSLLENKKMSHFSIFLKAESFLHKIREKNNSDEILDIIVSSIQKKWILMKLKSPLAMRKML